MNKQDPIHALPGFGPMAQPERIEILDILRGFALLCILIVNWSVDLPWDVDYWEGFRGTADNIAYRTVEFLLNEKARPMFAFMFGLGFAIQMQRAESRTGSFIAVYSRRLFILFLIGAAHYILTERDILFQYALFGFLLFPLRKMNLRLLIVLSIICIAGVFIYTEVNRLKNQKKITMANNAKTVMSVDSSILDAYVGVYENPERTFFVMRKKNELFVQPNGLPPRRFAAESPTKFFFSTLQISFVNDSAGTTVNGLLATWKGKDFTYRKIQSGQPMIDDATLRQAAKKDKSYRTYATGSFGEIVSMRAKEFWEKISSWTSYINWLKDPFAIFLLGLYAGRKRIFHSISNHRKFIRKIMWWGLIFGLAAQVVNLFWELWLRDDYNLRFWTEAFLRLTRMLGELALALGYLAALTLLLKRTGWKKKIALFAPVGQMALTNYLLQSVAFVLLFFGFGLGWYGKFGAFGGVLLSVALFALQIIFSQWWLRHFRFGPFEWLWRSLTYWKLQPMRKKQ